MTLSDRIVTLAQLSLNDPRRAARALLSEDVPMPARTGGLLLVAVLSAFLASIQSGLQTQALDPVSAFMMASPIRAAVIQWLFLALSVLLIHNVGRAFGGTGSFPDALIVVVWLQLLMLALQLVQLVAFLMSPPLAGLIGLAGLALFFWLMASFVAELHGFASRGAVLAGIIAVTVATGLVIGVAVVLVVGPEVFLAHV
jgi:Yip1 domain